MTWPSSPTLADLTAEVQVWLDRDDDATVGRVGSFIRYAHDEIVQTLRIPLVRRVVTGTISAERTTIPADLQAIRSLNIDDDIGRELRATSEGLRASHAAIWPVGRPREWVMEQGSIAFAPVPDASYSFTLTYDASPFLMTSDSDTNQVLTKRPFLYLQGALSAGFMFNQFAEQAELWEAKFRQTLSDMQRQGIADAFSGPLQLRSSVGFAP